MERVKFTYLYLLWVCLSLTFIAYDAFFAKHEAMALACFAWLATLFMFVKCKHKIFNVSIFLKLSSLVILAFVAFVSYGKLIQFIPQFFSVINGRALKIAVLAFQDGVAAIFVSIMVSFPLACLFEKRILLPSIIVCSPILIVSLEDILTTEKITAQFLIGFEIFANIFFVWLGVVVCKKYLTNRSSTAPSALDSF